MIRLTDQFLIAVPKVYDEGDVDGIKLMESSHYIDKERDRYERKIRKGTVYRAPSGYTDTKHMPIDPGLPNPKLFIGHDAIQERINLGYKDWGNHSYHPGITEGFQYISRADYGRLITAKDGDEVYFHPSVTEEDNFHGIIDGMEIYRAQVHELISVGLVTQGFWVLVEPHLEDKERDGLLLSIDDHDKLLEGTVMHCRPGSLSPGQVVYFQEGSDWSFEIEGHRFFAMLEENIVLTLDHVGLHKELQEN